MSLRSLTKSVVNKAGYDLHRRANSTFGQDAYQDQMTILQNVEVQTIFDVGANKGQTTAVYKTLFPGAVIHSFEPFADTFAELENIYAGDDHVRPHRLAVTDSSGTGNFHVNRSPFTNSLLSATEEGDEYQNIAVVAVTTTTLDDFCTLQEIEEIDILKMDIQGTELMALKGAAEKLRRASVSLIYTEVLFAPLYDGQAQFYEVGEFFSRYGYVLYGLYNMRHTTRGRLAWGDAVFVSPRLA